jgi:DNA-binding transcriptional regulator YiaG
MSDKSTFYDIPVPFEKRGAKSFIVYAAYPFLMAGLASSGTGTTLRIDPNSLLRTSGINFIDSVTPTVANSRRRAYGMHIGLISDIRSGLRLNTSALATMLQVSRTAIYDWLQGAAPKPDMLNKLAKLAKHAEAVRALGIGRVEMFHHLPLIDGKNLLAILSEDRDVDQGIRLLAERAKARSSRADQRANRSRGSTRVSSSEERFTDLTNLG